MVFGSLADPKLADLINSGAIGVLRTDTIYGIVAKASDEDAVERVYRVKGRTPTKSPIVLISSSDQLFSPAPPSYQKFLDNVWPGKNSVIIPTPDAPSWISRGNGTVAYRLPDYQELTELIKLTGPLAAPSANPESLPPAQSVSEATSYFGDKVDFYVDSGLVTDNTPSALYVLNDEGEVERLR